ncbi:MAG: selenocysteine-specific translation elongation factor [Candidatus Methylomirabilota bacterium]|nr:MAG: selenocysteine-specific translation elongation factor [candidate division NC10 bacterium]
MKHMIVGTAGHIDHGKTALVKALTGIDTDRLKEEQERGISIELGFAGLALSDDLHLGIVDVPGHERFVKTMLAGVGGIDLVVLVIAADEGVMPQTREHLHICELLQVKRGVVALTKADLVEPDWLEMVRTDLKGFLAGTFLEGAPVVAISAVTGQGIPQLRAVLREAAETIEPRRDDGVFRLPIDRVFTIKGFGTVVTGTLWSGTVRVGDDVVVLPRELHSRVRRLQVHGQTVEQAWAGQRIAVNLPGVDVDQLNRGDLLVFPGSLTPTMTFDVSLALLKDAPRALRNRARVRFHVGTSEILARVVLLDREELNPGDETFAHVRLEAMAGAMAGDRYVIRSYSPAVTIGGGSILDPNPPTRRRAKASLLEHLKVLQTGSSGQQVERLLAQAGPTPISLDALRVSASVDETTLRRELARLVEGGAAMALGAKGDPGYIHRSHYDRVAGEILSRLEDFHKHEPLKEGLPKEELRSKLHQVGPVLFARLLQDLIETRHIVIDREKVRHFLHRPTLSAPEQAVKDRLAAIYRHAALRPPDLEAALTQAGADRKSGLTIFRRLVDEGEVIKIKDNFYLHRDHYNHAKELLLNHFTLHAAISVQQFKELLGISRKFAIPFLEHFDGVKLTRRHNDERVLYT